MSSPKTKPRHLFEHGCLSYLQIPATDVRASGKFYASVFGWEVSERDDDHMSFSDATRGMIGAWVTERVSTLKSGVIPYIYVHGIDAVLQRIRSLGGEVIKPIYPEGDLWVATFRDPGGNEIGIWQQEPR
jgi:predicted enzyme related to lactoylglutathione lyase